MQPHNDAALGVSSLLSAWRAGVRSISTCRSPPPRPLRAALGSSLCSTFHDSALCPGPLTSPVSGRTEGFSILAVSPWPPSRPPKLPAGTRPPVPFQFMSNLPSPRAPARHGGCPPRTGKSLSAPAPPLSGLREVGPPAQGKSFPGAGARWGRYRKCREKPWSFPIWSRGWWRRSRCRRQRVAERREQNEGAATPRASAGPARAAPPEPARPAARRPPLFGWLRPAPPLRGDPSSSSRGAGAAPAVAAPSLGPLH